MRRDKRAELIAGDTEYVGNAAQPFHFSGIERGVGGRDAEQALQQVAANGHIVPGHGNDLAGILEGGGAILELFHELRAQLGAIGTRIDEQRFEPVGATESTQVDVRVVASTNKTLDEEIERGNFREDLFYRLNVIELKLPPLAARPADILPLARHFLGAQARPLHPSAQAALLVRLARVVPEITAVWVVMVVQQLLRVLA